MKVYAANDNGLMEKQFIDHLGYTLGNTLYEKLKLRDKEGHREVGHFSQTLSYFLFFTNLSTTFPEGLHLQKSFSWLL